MIRRSFLVASACAVGAAWAQPGTPVVPDVILMDEQGRTFRLRSLLAERTVAINFIFTGCTSFCPPQTAVFRAAQERLGELRSVAHAPLLLSLSVDPLNDSPKALSQYAARFDARLGLNQGWLMLTGEPAAVERTSRAFGASSVRVDDHPVQLWVGCAPKSRWFSTTGLASADDVLRLMKAAAA
jgi:protein SCO1